MARMPAARRIGGDIDPTSILAALPDPVMVVDGEGQIGRAHV